MTNESSRHGERIASLEERYTQLTTRLNHLDQCLDGAKLQAAENFSAIQKKLTEWESRWKFALAFLLGAIIAAGSGTVSLKSLIDLLEKIH